MGNEIERKFLVPALPDLCPYLFAEIVQGYIAIMANGGEVRLRRKANDYYLTVKNGEGLIRSEVEIELSLNQFEALWPLTEGRRIEKKRYKIKYEGALIELDIYQGNHEGLIIAEVEFLSAEAACQFKPPNWFGNEVTEDPRYKNRQLAGHGFPGRKSN